jgi:uncharacterized membrane protein
MPELYLPAWILWALLSAAFAALTAIFAKIGVASIDADLATFIRTVVIVVVLGAIVFAPGRVQPLAGISARTLSVFNPIGACHRGLLGMLLPSPETR